MNVSLNLPAPALWQTNGVHSGRSRSFHTSELVGTLSVKTVLSGRGVWTVPGKSFEITPDRYLVLNHGQQYRLDIQANQPTHTFCVFFRPGFVETIHSLPDGSAHDPLEYREPRPFEVRERLQPTGDHLMAEIERFARLMELSGPESGEVEDAFHRVAHALAQSVREWSHEPLRLDSLRPAVRDELYFRLSRVREMMIAQCSQPFDLAGLAREASLSPSHFHHLFRLAYGLTPHQALTQFRIRRAQSLLKSTDWTVETIAGSVGFESVSSFCRLHRRHTGVTPSELRRIS